jgi:tRNA(Arg) A34 adenosine deaminase TadA
MRTIDGPRRAFWGVIMGWPAASRPTALAVEGFPMPRAITIDLPDWVAPFLRQRSEARATPEAQMRLAIDLARQNVEQQSGGPFGAVVLDASGRVVGAGVNAVVANCCSVLHAEVIAIALAQQQIGQHDLAAAGEQPFTLASSTEPCVMCLGAVVWSGVGRLLCGARDEDARRVGFDEGPKPADWPGELEQRGITVVADVLRDEAAAVLELYAKSGGEIYNPRRNTG